MLEDVHARGIVSEVVDGLSSGDRAAIEDSDKHARLRV